MSEEQEKDPQIIIDEDWKTQVQAEKEAAAANEEPADSAESETPEPHADTVLTNCNCAG